MAGTMVPRFSSRPGITEPIFILSPVQGCKRTQRQKCSTTIMTGIEDDIGDREYKDQEGGAKWFNYHLKKQKEILTAVVS